MPFFALFFLLICCALPAYAQDAGDARKALSGTLSDLKAASERQKALEQKAAALESDLKTLQREMVTLAGRATKAEEELSSLEEKLAILEEQKKEKSTALAARQAELSSMLSAMIKLRQLPPEAVIAMPGKLDETLATARALGIVTHTIEEEADSLKEQINALSDLEDKIKQSQEAIADKKAALQDKQQELAAKLRERSRLQAEIGGRQREEKERMAKLTEKSQSLQELLDSLEKSEHASAWDKEAAPAVRQHEHAPRHKLRAFADAEGEMPRPAAGKIISRFGDTALGATFSKGIVIETRAQAGVIAPYDGEVVFAGLFRDYGHMVIIRHSNDYHTLLSGMERLDCTPGQFLLEGEPIGAMGKRAADNHLYAELRKDGKPVDPLPWFKD